MAPTPIAFASKDNAKGQLQSGIDASVTSIPLKSGEGALFPQPYNGTATSGGTSTTLNSTGISAAIGGSAAVGKFIWNKTDGSIARIKSVATNSVTTTRLVGGTGNTWDNADVWVIDPFVATFEIVNTNAYGVKETTQYEEALIIGRSTDTLTVATGGRGYNGTTANTFSADDWVYLHVTSPIIEDMLDVIGEVAELADDNQTNISSNDTDISNLQSNLEDDALTWLGTVTGTDTLTATATPTRSAYAAGQRFAFIVANDNTGAVTLNIDSLGAKAIKRLDGATALVSGDLQQGQVAEVRYDGTNFQLTSPRGQESSSQGYVQTVYLGYTDSSANSGSNAAYDTHNYDIPANDLINGVAYEIEGLFDVTSLNGGISIGVALEGTEIVQSGTAGGTTTTQGTVRAVLRGTAAAGASVTVRGEITVVYGSTFTSTVFGSASVATNGILTLELNCEYGTSGSSVLKSLTIKKISTSLFP